MKTLNVGTVTTYIYLHFYTQRVDVFMNNRRTKFYTRISNFKLNISIEPKDTQNVRKVASFFLSAFLVGGR
jgi:hypothetical protein